MNVDNLPLEARQRIDAHLDAIDEVLKREGMSREERRNIVDNVETQILEMLSREAPDTDPALAQVEAVLARMDRPEAYGHTLGGEEKKPPRGTTMEATLQFAPPTPGQPRMSRAAIWGAVCIGLSLLGWLAAGVMMVPMFFVTQRVMAVQDDFGQHDISQRTHWFSLVLLVLILCLGFIPSLLGTLLGWIALLQIRSSKGLLRGSGLAWFDALFYPLLVALLALVGLLFLA